MNKLPLLRLPLVALAALVLADGCRSKPKTDDVDPYAGDSVLENEFPGGLDAPGDLPLGNEQEGIQLLRQYAADGAELVLLISWRHHYTRPLFRMPPDAAAVTRISRFPKLPLGCRGGVLAVADPVRRIPLHLTPMGLLSFVIQHRKDSVS